MPVKAKGTALITGGARRIGAALALDLAAQGYDIALHYNTSKADATKLAAQIEKAGGLVVLVRGDLARADCARVIDAARRQLGPLTVLVNNASIYEFDEAKTMTARSWQRHMDINLRAPVFLAQAFAKQLPKGAQGNIINLIDGRVWKLNPRYFTYTLSKSALWTATQTLAQSLAPRIRVNAIGPGPVLPPKGVSAAAHARDEAATLLGRGTSPAEIAQAVRFILSQPSLTGQMIALDGGQHLLWQTREMKGGR